MNNLGKPLTHSWQDEERLVLCLIKTFYSIGSKETAAIFNHIFESSLLAEGHVDGLRRTTLATMLHELRNRRSHIEPMKSVLSLSLSRLRHRFWRTKNQIEDAALELGFELRLKSKEDHRIRGSLTKRLLNVRYRDISREDTPSSYFSLESDSDESPCKGKHRNVRTGRSTTSNWDIQLLSSTKEFDGSTGQKHPTLLYRAFENAHGFLSRHRLSRSVVKSPPVYATAAFCDLVKPHLMIDDEYISPFISLTQFPKAAIKYLNGRKDSSLAVFDFNSLAADAAARFPNDKIPYLVPSICHDHEIDDLPGGYTGFGEWLAYSSITAEPLVVWNLTESQAIEKHLKSMDSITFTGGQALAKYFRNVPEGWKATIAFQLLCSFKVKGYEQGRNSVEIDGFMRGLHDKSPVSIEPSSPPGDEPAPRNNLTLRKSIVLSDSDSDSDDQLVPRNNTPSSRSRRILRLDSDDQTVLRHDRTARSEPVVLSDPDSDPENQILLVPQSQGQSQRDLSRIQATNLQTFRQQLQSFTYMVPQSDGNRSGELERKTVPESNTSTDKPSAVADDSNCWEVIDLTNEIGEDEVVFQRIRRVALYKRDLSIRSKSSNNA